MKLSEQAAWRAEALGPPQTLDLGAGRRIRAHVTGEGPAIVFVHGVLVNANLWRKLVPLLDGYTRVTLDLPLGSHLEPMVRSADLSPPALAELIADAVAALGLEDATIVGNDTGGALTQIMSARRPERIGRLVLTSCDAFENFPPRFFRVVLAPARIPGGTWFHFRGLWLRPLRRLPIAYGWLTNAPIEPAADEAECGATCGRCSEDSTRATPSRPRRVSRTFTGPLSSPGPRTTASSRLSTASGSRS
jgi:pimeloyl-ACP methyl ester carboxylesterase